MPHIGESAHLGQPGIAGQLAEHANAENTNKKTNYDSDCYCDTVVNLANLVSQNIVTTVECLIIVVTTAVLERSAKGTDIQRGGVNKTLETTISAGDAGGWRLFLQYSVELHAAGNYTYDLVNTSGGGINVIGSTIKIVAVEL